MTTCLIFFLIIPCLNVICSSAEIAKCNGMVEISGGKFRMGTDVADGKDGEGPSRSVHVSAFKIDKCPVTNEDFRKFVREKKFKTESERFGWSFVFHAFVPEDIKSKIKQAVQGAPWWLPVHGAYWRQLGGPGTSIKEKLQHPVVHVSYNDAVEYCKWAGKRLPTESEWEFTARGKKEGKQYPWGEEFLQKRMNIWQGEFPFENSLEDGYHWSSPVDAFPPQNDYGMYDMLGNAWEWVSDEYKEGASNEKKYVLRGGSYLDTVDGKHNHKVRVTTRMGNTADAGSDNITFRCAKDTKEEL